MSNNSLGVIYVYRKLYENNPITVKIGSTINFVCRMSTYLTSERYFNNNNLKIWKFDIIKSNYDCYEIDKIIRASSQIQNKPYKYFYMNNGDGGLEHYYFDDIATLCNFFDNIEIEYKMTNVDVDLLRKQISEAHYEKLVKCYINDAEKKLNNFDVKKALHKINIMITDKNDKKVFKLLDFQEEIYNLIQKIKNRLFHIIIAPTGTGKTITFTTIILYKILTTNKDVIIMTKRKEILNQMKIKIPENIKKIKNNKIVNISFEPKIIDCVDKFDINKFNKKNDIPSIYIINFDKFTNSTKMDDLNKIKFKKFSTLIIDESHWIGAEQINKLLSYIKNETTIDVIGFSATPIRCNKKNKELTESLFEKNKMFDNTSIDKKINILYEYSYYNALKNGIICPISWIPIIIEEKYLIDENKLKNDGSDNSENDNITERKNKILHHTAFNKVWNEINNKIIVKSFKKKGILWFRKRKDLLEFYYHIKEKIPEDIKMFCTMTYEENEKEIKKLVDKCKLNKEHFDNALNNFESENQNAILLSVFRAIEGFDDEKIDFGIRMYYSNYIDAVTETQRMGRMNRLCTIVEKNGKESKKVRGYFGTLEIKSDVETMKKNIISRLKNWIAFARSWNDDLNSEIVDNGKNSIEIKEKLKEIMSTHIDANILNVFDIDIEKEVLQCNESLLQEFKEIKKYIKKLNIISKDEYNNLTEKDKNLIKSPDSYFDNYWNGWYDYLNINTDKLIKDKTKWKEKCEKLNIQSVEDYYEKCKSNHELPIYPNEIYYNFTNIDNELNIFNIDDYY